MKIRLLLSLAFLWAACATAVAAPTVQVTPSVAPADAASPAAQPTAAPTAAPVDLPATFEQIKGVDDLPLPQDGPGLWRLYDEEAQVVCYLYGANRLMGQTTVTWSGLSCLPASQTRLGQR